MPLSTRICGHRPSALWRARDEAASLDSDYCGGDQSQSRPAQEIACVRRIVPGRPPPAYSPTTTIGARTGLRRNISRRLFSTGRRTSDMRDEGTIHAYSAQGVERNVYGFGPARARRRPASGQRAYTVGTDTDAHGTMYVPVRLNQRMPATFFFDTGSSTFVSDAFVAKHALPTQPLGPKNGYPFKLPDGSPVLVTHLDIQIGETPILISQDVPVLKSAVIRSMGVECDGILGVDSVNGMAVHVNLAARQIAFIPGGNLSASMRKRLGIDTVKPAPLIPAEGGRYQVPATVGELPTTLMLVDTGSEFTRIPAASANKIGSAWRPSGVIDTAEGRFPVYSTYAAKLTVDGASVPRQRVLYSDRSAGPSPGPLGRDFFSRFAVTIDYPAGRLYLRDLDVAAGPSPFSRRLRGDEALFPTYTVAFPYGGKTVRNGESRRYDPGASAAFPGAEGPDGVKVSRNGPS